jgi:bifunctional non-homologous end joining protein LigD
MRFAFIEPLLPTLVEKPPEGDGWFHEVKFDGYRSQLVIDDVGVRIFTVTGWTGRRSTATWSRPRSSCQ